MERIWMPFAIWVLLAAEAFTTPRSRRAWLGAQLLTGLALQTLLVTNW